MTTTIQIERVRATLEITGINYYENVRYAFQLFLNGRKLEWDEVDFLLATCTTLDKRQTRLSLLEPYLDVLPPKWQKFLDYAYDKVVLPFEREHLYNKVFQIMQNKMGYGLEDLCVPGSVIADLMWIIRPSCRQQYADFFKRVKITEDRDLLIDMFNWTTRSACPNRKRKAARSARYRSWEDVEEEQAVLRNEKNRKAEEEKRLIDAEKKQASEEKRQQIVKDKQLSDRDLKLVQIAKETDERKLANFFETLENLMDTIEGVTVFHLAAIENNHDFFNAAMAALKTADVDNLDTMSMYMTTQVCGLTPIHCAIFEGSVDVLRMMSYWQRQYDNCGYEAALGTPANEEMRPRQFAFDLYGRTHEISELVHVGKDLPVGNNKSPSHVEIVENALKLSQFAHGIQQIAKEIEISNSVAKESAD
jgi:hypothetical protein